MLTNTDERYGLISQVLHWMTAGMILFLIPLGVFMHELPNGNSEEVAYKFWFYSLHKTLGIAVFAIALIRVIWTLVQPHPRLLNPDRKLESFAAQTVHWVLYGCIILMPLSGWLHHAATEGFAEIWWPFSQDLPIVPKDGTLALLFQTAHFSIGVVLVVSLFLHIGGALKHTIVDKDSTLTRMIPGMRSELPDGLAGSSVGGKAAIVAIVPFLIVVGVSAYAVQDEQSHAFSEQKSITDADVSGEVNNWIVDYSKSSLDIEVVQNGNPVKGSFTNWDADIFFDPENLKDSRINVLVEVAGLELGAITKQALAPEILNVEEYQQAKFFAETFTDRGNGLYEAIGELSLVGVTNQLIFPFVLEIQNDRAVVNGKAVLKRLEYGIGEKSYPDSRTVGLEVAVNIKLEADRKN